MSTVNISENTTLSQTIEKQIKATIDSVEVSAKVTMTNGKVTAYMDGQIKESDNVMATFYQYAGSKMQLSADIDYLTTTQTVLTPFMEKMDAIALTVGTEPDELKA